jgi:hypothetical protein
LIFFLFVPLVGLSSGSSAEYFMFVHAAVILDGYSAFSGQLVGCAILLAASISKDFRSYGNVPTDINTSQPANGK